MKRVDEREGYEKIGENMSNFDHSIDEGMAEKLKSGKYYSEHCGWDFWGAVWYEDGMFHEEVRQYGSTAGVMSAETLKELMEKVNDEYGWG
jgi:hypothetical protein